MFKNKLVRSAIAHEAQSRVPMCVHLAEDALQAYSQRLFDRYASHSTKKLVESGLITFSDGLKLSMGNSVLTVGCPWWGWYDVPPDYSKPNSTSPFYLPKIRGSGSYEAFAEHVTLLSELTGCYILVLIYGSHFEKANSVRGIENFMADMGDPDSFAQELLNFIVEQNMSMLRAVADVPHVDGILLGSDWGSQRSLLMSPAMWRTMLAPGEKKEYDIIKRAGKQVWLHSCGNIEAILPDLAEMGVDVLNPLQPECMDIAAIKAEFGDRLTFWGGIGTQQILPYGTPEEVVAETRRVTRLMSQNGGYIISPAQEIQADVPFENIVSLIETARSYSAED